MIARKIIPKTITAKAGVLLVSLCFIVACKTPAVTGRQENTGTPAAYGQSQDTLNSGTLQWRKYFADPMLAALIDTALKNNQELNISLQEIAISRNEIKARKGEYLPFVNIGAAAGLEKEGRYTRHGAVDETVEMKPGKEIPKVLPDLKAGVFASWEIDVWRKLRNAKKSAMLHYLSSVEGRNFMITNLIAEIASSYFELMALDNKLEIVQWNIEIQNSALQIIKKEKDAAKVSQLAVNRFEAQLLNTKNLQYAIRQDIIETENRLNFLIGRFPQPIQRNATAFGTSMADTVYAGIPSQLLLNRPDIRKAQLELAAAKIDVQVARADFYPSFRLTAGAGLQAFNPSCFINPESIIYNLAGDMVAPLINKNAIKATYLNANAKQVQAVYDYERSILNAHIEVVNELARMKNFSESYAVKSAEADILVRSINISNNLFSSARADYVEVLLTQREALEARMDLVEIKLKQLAAKINVYKSLGGGWN